MSQGIKYCYWCKSFKTPDAFNKNKAAKDGLQKKCRECNKITLRAHKEKIALQKGKSLKPYAEKSFSSITSDELINYLKLFSNLNNRAPTTRDLANDPNYPNAYTYYRHFKYRNQGKYSRWNDILKLAGLNPIENDDLWQAWEYLVERAALILYNDIVFQANNLVKGVRPDIYIPNQNLIIDAATSNYISPHKEKQYLYLTQKGFKVEYWCLYKTSKVGLNKPNLDYVFSEDVIERLKGIDENNICDDIRGLLNNYEKFKSKISTDKKTYLIQKILQLKNLLGRTPKTRDFDRLTNFPSSTMISKTFGSFNEALVAAGLNINKVRTQKSDLKIAAQELVQFSQKLGRLPKSNELGLPNTTYSYKIYGKYWGGIENCLKSQGIDFEKLKMNRTKETISFRISQFIEFKNKHNRFPKTIELRKNNDLPSLHWIIENFERLEIFIQIVEESISQKS